jgi:crotonobetainyl-CoA:carnitine CoA-transferase CaiB-like acyl-CoA transferase
LKNSKDLLDKPGPLEGITVVEFGVFHAGPGAGAILGDLGASVIKIEENIGDPLRHWARVGAAIFGMDHGKSPMFEFSNRNKRSLYLDIKTAEGRNVFHRLIETADVFLTNLRKSTKIEMKIDYDSIRAINPKIIYAGVSGYGKNGPVSDTGAYDPLGQARSGMMFLTDSDEPKLIQLAILDQATAITASHAIMTALFVRERHGIGQEVHNSLYSTALWLTYANLMLSNFGIDVSELTWVRSRNDVLRNSYCCGDGKWIICTHHPTAKYWPTLCAATGQEPLMSDPRFCDEENRNAHNAELVAHFDGIFSEKTQAEWIDIFTKAGLMFSPVQEMKRVLEDPQALANNYVVEFDHPGFGKMKMPGYPIDFSTFSAGIRHRAPEIGEHTDEILKELGYGEKDISALKRKNIIKNGL